MQVTLQLCTFNRAALLARVLDACFEQTVDPVRYEVVLVNDGSTDETAAVIARAKERAGCEFTVIDQPNSGLAKGRNAGIARARGERIIFIDDDVLPLPDFVEEHLRSHARSPASIVRGGAINVENFDELPPAVWRLKDYSGNFFWTTNVSVPLAAIRAIGGFNETFAEYGWEDIDVGLRLRAAGVRAVFNRHALVYHYKPRPDGAAVDRMLRQARAQARTAVQLAAIHPHWRVYAATGDNALQRTYHRWTRALGMPERYRRRLEAADVDRPLDGARLRAARLLAAESYFEELERARSAAQKR